MAMAAGDGGMAGGVQDRLGRLTMEDAEEVTGSEPGHGLSGVWLPRGSNQQLPLQLSVLLLQCRDIGHRVPQQRTGLS